MAMVRQEKTMLSRRIESEKAIKRQQEGEQTDELPEMRNTDEWRNLPRMRISSEQNDEETGAKDREVCCEMIKTRHLILRPFEASDFDLIYRIYSDEDILKYTPFDPMDEKQAEKHLQKVIDDWKKEPCLSHEFAVCLREKKAKIGRAHVLVDPETDTGMIGMFLVQDYWGKHYASEIAESLICYSFRDLHLHRVNAVCNPENTASWKMLEKCGLRREALLLQKCRYVKKGLVSWHDELEYAMLVSEYSREEAD